MTTQNTLFAAAALLAASFGLSAQPTLSDHAVVTAVPRLTGIPTCINMEGPMADKVRKEVYNLGSRRIAVGDGACAGKTALGFFFAQPQELGRVQESGPGFSNSGTPWLVETYAVVVKNGRVGEEVARAGSAMLAGSVYNGGLYKDSSPGEAIAHSEQRAVGKLFKKDAWHIGAAEVLAREFGSKSAPIAITSTTAPTSINSLPVLDVTRASTAEINARTEALKALARQTEADAKSAKAEAKARAEAEKRLKKAAAELDKANKATAKK